MVLGMLPVVGFFYDAYTLWLGKDPITGQPLTDFDRALIWGGMLAGLVGASFLNEAADLSSAMLKNVSKVDNLADAAKGLSRVDDVTAVVKNLDNLDETLVVARNLDNLDETLLAAKNLDNTDEILSAGSKLDDLEAPLNTTADLSRADELAYTPRLSNNLDDAPVIRPQRTDAPEGSNFGGVCERNSFTAGTVVQTDEGECRVP